MQLGFQSSKGPYATGERKEFTMKKISVGMALLISALGVSTLASAQTTTPATTPLSQDIKNDRADIVQDRQAIDQMKQQERSDAQKLKADKRARASASQIAADQ